MAPNPISSTMATQSAVCVMGVIASLLVACAGALDFVKFGYTGATGPQNWGSLSPDYALCSKGKNQSPINIVKKNAVENKALNPLDRDYYPTNATLIDNGFNVMLKFDDDVGELTLEGKKYALKQMHWHSPSEHTIDGERFPMELHLLHASDDKSLAVISILYQYGHADPFLYQLKEKLEELSKEACSGDTEAHISVDEVDTKALRRHTRKYFRYVGSLSTPPCTENVTWNILGKVREMSKDQADLLRSILGTEYKNNSRPIQNLNNRKVEMYYE
ncbi:hypothetical protein Taro_035817 [Colocasia esculenta]|uniref:Carbonic anhydrase n=1 Tax=Colocasia esculenta TaxID=4460 RepID=A0A843WFY2_COLES|nr:hypothetical protein [Colocasia esculenta]